MENFFGSSAPSMSTLTDFSKLSRDDRVHLKKVYSSLILTLMASTAGASVNAFFGMFQGSILTAFATFGLLIALNFTPDNGKNLTTRLGMLLAFGFFMGVSLGPLIAYVAFVDPSLIFTALGATVVIFSSFTLSALYAESRSMLYLGGYLMSGLNMLIMASLANMFLGSMLLFDVQLYLGLFIFCGFILYDTQLIIERSRNGDKDFIGHSITLFLDFIQLFRRILIILSKDEKKKSKK